MLVSSQKKSSAVVGSKNSSNYLGDSPNTACRAPGSNLPPTAIEELGYKLSITPYRNALLLGKSHSIGQLF